MLRRIVETKQIHPIFDIWRIIKDKMHLVDGKILDLVADQPNLLISKTSFSFAHNKLLKGSDIQRFFINLN